MKRCKPVGPGEWQQPINKGYLMQCCDCGLIHSMDFRLWKSTKDGWKIQFRAYRITKNGKRIQAKKAPPSLPMPLLR